MSNESKRCSSIRPKSFLNVKVMNMTYCFVCQREIDLEINWLNLFSIKKESPLCIECEKQYKRISGSRCKRCSRRSKSSVCQDCEKWLTLFRGNDPLIKNVSIYEYNEQMKEFITKWKYRGDYILAEIFRASFKRTFHHHFPKRVNYYAIVPIPLSKERLNVRAFNQAYMLAAFLTKKPTECFVRIHNEKQAKKTRYERLMTKNPFQLTKRIDKPTILIDDIYTTGRTLRHAATLLRASGCPEVYAYTLIRG